MRLDPANARQLSNLGLALLQSGDRKARLDALRTAVQMDPANATTHYRLGRRSRVTASPPRL